LEKPTGAQSQVLFHEFTHIQSDHRIFHAKIGFSQGFAEFRLANTWQALR
jgi:hypothetical protein